MKTPTPFELGLKPYIIGKWGFNELMTYIHTYNKQLQELGGSIPRQVVSMKYLILDAQIHDHNQSLEYRLRDVLSHVYGKRGLT